MSLYEFLERLEADPFDPALIALFDESAANSSQEVQNELS